MSVIIYMETISQIMCNFILAFPAKHVLGPDRGAGNQKTVDKGAF